jgi:hypothetical protein
LLKKQQRLKRLLVGTGGNVPCIGKMAQESFQFGRAYFPRMPFTMETHVVPDPMDIGPFRAPVRHFPFQ